MPPKRVCSDKVPLGENKVREQPGICFKKGLRAGFAAGIQKGTNQANEQGVKRARIVRAIPQAALQMKAKAGVRKAKETTARRAAEAAQAQERQLMASNDVNIEPPRVKPAGRRQKFRNFYALDRAAAVVAPNPVGAPIDERPSISDILRDELARRKSKSKIDVLISNASFPVPELTRNVKKAMGTAAMIQYLKNTKGYRD